MDTKKEWAELWDAQKQPTEKEISEYVENPLWDDLADYLQKTYSGAPKYTYSRCNLDKGLWQGWNVKYQKSGRSLCTLYPKQGWFLALVTIGAPQAAEADLLIPLCDEYTQQLYKATKNHPHYGRMLAMEVRDEGVLWDVKTFAGLRAKPVKKAGTK